MWIISKQFPFLHKFDQTKQNPVVFAVQITGAEEAKAVLEGLKEVLADTQKQAHSVREETAGILSDIQQIQKMSPKDNLDNAGIE